MFDEPERHCRAHCLHRPGRKSISVSDPDSIRSADRDPDRESGYQIQAGKCSPRNKAKNEQISCLMSLNVFFRGLKGLSHEMDFAFDDM